MGLLSGLTSGFGLLGGVIDSKNGKAAKKATKAVQDAADKNRALFEQIYNQSRNDLAPYNQAGQNALARLQQRTGLTPINRPASAPASNPGGYVASPGAMAAAAAGPQGAPMGAMGGGAGGVQQMSATGQPDFAAYGAANPDLQAEWQRIQQTGNAEAFGNDPNAYYQWHYGQYGQNEGRSLPTSGAQPPQDQAPVDPNAPPDEYFQETYAQRPDALQVPTYERQQALDAPSLSGFIDPSKFQVDPGYQFRLKEGLGAVNAASAARGKLRSGDAARALQERGEGLANQGYNDWYNRQLAAFDRTNSQYQYGQGRQDRNFLDDRSYGTNLWNTQQNRQDNVFDVDRGFTANRFDQQNANLFNLTNMGQNAAAGTASAGNIFAGNVAQGNNNVAQTTANGALWRQGQLNNMFGSALNLAGTFAGGGF